MAGRGFDEQVVGGDVEDLGEADDRVCGRSDIEDLGEADDRVCGRSDTAALVAADLAGVGADLAGQLGLGPATLLAGNDEVYWESRERSAAANNST